MPLIPQKVQQALYELQEYCKTQENCNDCSIKSYCNKMSDNCLSDLGVQPTGIQLNCKDKRVCADFILIQSELRNEKIKSSKALSENEFYLKTLNELCPHWKVIVGSD